METRRLAAWTTGLTFLLLLVGVYTKEVGADLTCGMNWPLCDGAVFGLFPANLPSFIEWFHRLLALVVGLLIIYFVYRLYQERGAGSRITRAASLALVLLPLQAALGALTVLKTRLLGGGFHVLVEGFISVAHFGTGLGLFTALVAATLWTYEEAGRGRPGASSGSD